LVVNLLQSILKDMGELIVDRIVEDIWKG
jgi:hypothetical protein